MLKKYQGDEKMRLKIKRALSSLLVATLLGQNLLYSGIITNLTNKISASALTTVSKSQDSDVSDINISGYVGLEDGRTAEISVLIFDDNWNTIAETKVYPGEYFCVSASNVKSFSSTTHIKVECNGYLPRFYKDMGFGAYQIGTSDRPELLYFGDTTYNTGAENQWSDEVINYEDLSYVSEQIGKIQGDENYDDTYDLNNDGFINNADFSLIADYDGAIFEDDVWYTSSTKEYYYTDTNYISIFDLNHDQIINDDDQNFLYDLYPCESRKGDADFNQFAYMDINSNGEIDYDDYQYFADYIAIHNGCNPYNDYIYNLTLTGDCYHEYAMYLENTNLDLASYDLVVNDNFVFRTQNPYNTMWNDNPGVTLNINAGTLFIANQFDFGQANSYDKIVMTNDDGKLYVNGIWNYITLADMEGLWTNGTIYFFGSTWQVNEESGNKSIYSTGTHSICFYYQYGQQIIRWANTEDCIYNEETGEYNTNRRFNFDYKDNNGKCLGVTFPCGYSDENYYFRASLPEEITLSESTIIPYEDWDMLDDNDNNTIPDVIDAQINSGVYDYIPDEWIIDEYGDCAEAFIEEKHPNNEVNKEALANTLEYAYSNYEEPVANEVSDYIGRSLEQIVLGNYTDEVTLAGTAGQIALGIFDLDLICDIRDLTYDIGELGEIIFGEEGLSWEFAGQFFFDVVGLLPVVGALKNVDEAALLAKQTPDLYNKAAVDSVTECFSHGKALKNETEIAETTTKNVKAVIKQSNELLGKDGKFLDESLEEQYQKYLKRKSKQKNATARDRLNWKEESDYWKYNSNTARGIRFNAIAQSQYDYNEVNLISNSDPNAFTRVDSYVEGKQIISRKATDLENIEFSTFKDYLSELAKKYKPGTKIRSNKYPELDGKELKGQMCLQIPKSNETFSDIERYKKYAKDNYDIEIIFLEE